MEFGIVIGTIVATIKDPSIKGCSLLVVQPIDQLGEKAGNPIVVLDPDNNAGFGDIIIFVHSPDASMALPGDIWAPIDAAVVAIVDHVDINQTLTLTAGEQWRLEKLLAQLQLQ
ncbi:MAG: EutN/CcmL family microcompartment protein [Anaerolineaceae bacterium]|nr:EutN/CcmL family microcompartment protein [Anaerolineaceae bacterium]